MSEDRRFCEHLVCMDRGQQVRPRTAPQLPRGCVAPGGWMCRPGGVSDRDGHAHSPISQVKKQRPRKVKVTAHPPRGVRGQAAAIGSVVEFVQFYRSGFVASGAPSPGLVGVMRVRRLHLKGNPQLGVH